MCQQLWLKVTGSNSGQVPQNKHNNHNNKHKTEKQVGMNIAPGIGMNYSTASASSGLFFFLFRLVSPSL